MKKLKRTSHQKVLFWVALLLVGIKPYSARADSDEDVKQIRIAEGQILYEFVGQGINLTATKSAQVGYFTDIQGLDGLFAGAPENEATALFTFYRDTTTVNVRANGPVLIVSRAGINTLYLNATPGADFSNPDSFRAGAAIQTSVFRQQAIIDTISQTFSIVDQDTITSTSVFSLNGGKYQIGKPGDVFRTTRNGHLNSPGSTPAGWLGGYSVGAEKSQSSDRR